MTLLKKAIIFFLTICMFVFPLNALAVTPEELMQKIQQLEKELDTIKEELKVLLVQADESPALSGESTEEPGTTDSIDEAFLNAMVAGLDKRWASANVDTSTYTNKEFVQYMEMLINYELNEIGDYRFAEFENARLYELAAGYINALDQQLEALSFKGKDDDKYNVLWDSAYNSRTKGIYLINQEYGLDVDDKAVLADMVATGSKIYKRDKIQKCFEDELYSLTYTIEKSGSYVDYDCVINNQYTSTLDRVSIQAILLDNDGVQIESKYLASADNWQSKSKIKGSMSTKELFSDIRYDCTVSAGDDYFSFNILVKDIGPQASGSKVARETDIKSIYEIEDLTITWDTHKSFGSELYVPTMKFNITNNTLKPVTSLKVLVTFNNTDKKEVWSDEYEYVIGSLDSPLQPGYSKKVFVYSSVGYKSKLNSAMLPALTATVYINDELYMTYDVVKP